MGVNSELFASACNLPIGDGRFGLRLTAPIVMSDTEGDTSSWVHFAPFGSWKGHESGAFQFTRDVFDNIVERFLNTANDIQVDYNHDSIKSDVTGPKPAAGWIKALEIRGDGRNKADGLWGLVEWTKRAAAFIRNREYKYTSPVIDFKSEDRKTGKSAGPELFNAALTNDPFLDGQVPLTLERLPMDIHINNGPKGPDEKKPAGATDDKGAKAMADEGASEGGGGGIIDQIAQASGLDPAAVEAAMLERMDDIVAIVVGSQGGDGTPADEAMASDQPPANVAADRWQKAEQLQLSAVSKRVEQLEADKKDAERKRIVAHVEDRIEKGFILDNLKADAIELYADNWERADKLFANKVVPIGRSQSKENVNRGAIALSRNEEAVRDNLISSGRYRRDQATQLVIADRKVN